MSQEAEYFLRNISLNEVRQLASRISRQDRLESERRAHAWWQQQSSALEGRMRGEIAGLRQEVELRHRRLEEQLDCNRRLTEALQRQTDLHGEVLLEQQKALEVLAEHDRKLDDQIQETRQIQLILTERITAAESRLDAEIKQRRQERELQAGSQEIQRRMAVEAVNHLDNQRLESLGLQADLNALRISLDRAIRVGATDAEEQAALALLAEVQNRTDHLTLESSRREDEIGRWREVARLSLETGRQRLAEFREDQEATRVFSHTIGAIAQQLGQATERYAALSTRAAGDFGSMLARWEHEAASASTISEQIEQLWRERDQVLDQIQTRNRIIEAVIEALIEVWGAQFEIDYMYAVTDDPRSTLMLQTKRAYGRNVTIHVDLDGRMQISFTGYLGMECAKDVAEFRSQLERAGDLKVEQVAVHDQPNQPNPPGVDGAGTGGPMVYRAPARQTKDGKKEAGRP